MSVPVEAQARSTAVAAVVRLMAPPYEPPPGFVSTHLSPSGLLALCAMVERSTSLPRLRKGTDLSGLSDDEIDGLVAALVELQVAEARHNAAAFVEYALANEKTGEALENAQHHNEWHSFLDAHRRAVLFAPVEHAKTTHVAVGRVLWSLGRNPSLRLALISNTAAQAEKILAAVKLNILENPKVREVFPELKPSTRDGDPWHGKAITVARPTIAKDPSIQALGVGGPLVGSRLDGAILDDVLDFENTRTAEQMAKLVEWCETTLLTRLTEGAFLHVIGTPWDSADLMHVLESRPGFASRRYSAVENPHDPHEFWRPLWPAQFSRERLKAIHDDMTPSTFMRKYFCLITSGDAARFRIEWLDEAARLGRTYQRFPLAPLVRQSGQPLPHFTGVDLAVGKNADSDLTVILTIALEDPRKIIVDLQAGRWQAPEILDRIRATQTRYGSHVVVEDNGAQSFLLQWAMDWGIPVTPFTTGRNKYDEKLGVESLAVEMRAGEWVFPCPAGGLPPELALLRRELEVYDPASHTGDRLMAMWFAREAARTRAAGVQRRMPTLAR